MNEYKDGRGDYYLAAGKQEERSANVERFVHDALKAEQATRAGNPATLREQARFVTSWLLAEDEDSPMRHEHDPDKCDECQEMVMEALRE